MKATKQSKSAVRATSRRALQKVATPKPKKDSITSQETIVFHSTSSSRELYDILVSRRFTPGVGGGSMLGNGFYANLHLVQAQKHLYGEDILKAKILRIEKFFFAEPSQWVVIHPEDEGIRREELFRKQLEPLNIPLPRKMHGSSSSVVVSIWKVLKRSGKFRGIVYKGRLDKESVVCWYMNDIIPLSVWDSKIEEWVSPQEYARSEVTKSEPPKSSIRFKEGAELWISAYKEALTLLEESKNASNSSIKSTVESIISSEAMPQMRYIKKEVYKEIFNIKL